MRETIDMYIDSIKQIISLNEVGDADKEDIETALFDLETVEELVDNFIINNKELKRYNDLIDEYRNILNKV